MEYSAIEDLLPRAGGSVYRLVRMASKRALEISEGKPPLINQVSSDKPTTIALQEISKGRVVWSEVAKNEAKDKK
jgi:DNA-directed RNA polymerase omega subunit